MAVAAGLEVGKLRACRECRAPIIGALTANGRLAPVRVESSDAGNVLLFTIDGVLNCRTFTGDALEELRRQGVPLKLNHFADCPSAEKFRERARER